MHFFPQKKNKQMYNIGYFISLMFNIIFDKKFIHKILISISYSDKLIV